MQIKNLAGVGLGLIVLCLAPTLVCAAGADSAAEAAAEGPALEEIVVTAEKIGRAHV